MLKLTIPMCIFIICIAKAKERKCLIGHLFFKKTLLKNTEVIGKINRKNHTVRESNKTCFANENGLLSACRVMGGMI